MSINWKTVPDVGKPIKISKRKIRITPAKKNEGVYPGFATSHTWKCPQCGTPVNAFTDENATLAEIMADGRCCYCKKGRGKR